MFNKTDPSYFEGLWSFEKTEHAVLGLCKILDRYAHKLTLEDLQNAHPLIRATHGLLFLKEMTAEGFVGLAKEMAESVGDRGSSPR